MAAKKPALFLSLSLLFPLHTYSRVWQTTFVNTQSHLYMFIIGYKMLTPDQAVL